MNDRQISIPDLAAYCKLDKSTVYKLIKGSRIPNQLSTIENIADYLRLNESDRQMLFDSYSIAQIGSERFFSRKAIEKGIKTLMGIQLPVKKAPVILVDELLSENRPVIALTNPLVIKEWIRRILIQCYSKTNEELRILTPFQHQKLMEMIFPFADHDLKVKHILPMRGRIKAGISEQQSDSLNCENVLQIIPHIMCHTDYDIYYYYTNSTDPDNRINHPYMISCSTIVVTFSNDLTSGIVYRDPEIVSYFNKSFEVQLKSCRRLFESIRESTNLVKFLSDTASYYKGSNLRLTYQLDPGLIPLLKP